MTQNAKQWFDRKYDTAHRRDDFARMERLNEVWDAAIEECEGQFTDRTYMYTDDQIAEVALRLLGESPAKQ